MFDAGAIYIGARMYDSQGPAAVRRLLVRRDQLLNDNASDKIAFVFDPFHDRQTRVWFELNPLGVKGAGEAGAIGAPPSVVNAIVDAIHAHTGVKHVDMPVTAASLWKVIEANRGKKAA